MYSCWSVLLSNCRGDTFWGVHQRYALHFQFANGDGVLVAGSFTSIACADSTGGYDLFLLVKSLGGHNRNFRVTDSNCSILRPEDLPRHL